MSNNLACYLGTKGYSIRKENLELSEQINIRKELTVKPYVPKNAMQKPNPFSIYRESNKKFYIPRFYGYDIYGEPEGVTLSEGDNIDLSFKGELRDYQKPIVETYVKEAKKNGGGLLEVAVGYGKTIMALNIISKLNKKTLIVVHKEFLLRQWMERIETFLPNAKVGRIQGEIIDIEGKDIVIGMLQSLSMKDYPISVFKSFGLSVYDECFPYKTCIETDKGLVSIGSLYEKWKNKNELPKILSFNQETKIFEYKKMTYAWRKEREDLIKISMSKRVINCTPEHKILTIDGYVEAKNLSIGDLILSKYDKNNLDNSIKKVLNEDYGTLKVTNLSYFKNKGANRCKKPYVYDIEVEDNHNFVIGTKSQKNKYIDGPVVSNCHHMSAEVFCKALFKIVTKYMLGLSATMKRKDNLSKVFKMFIGPIVYTKRREGGDGVEVQVIDYENNDPEYDKVELNWKGHVHYSKMIKKICEYNHRSEFLLKVLKKMLEDPLCGQIMILAHNKVLLKYLHDAIEDRDMATVGYYVGGMKEKDLKESETKKVVIGTYAMASEGLDIKSLTTLLMATPKSDVEQCIGRILRLKHKRPLVVDVVDQHDFFVRQFTKRKRFYAKEKYKIKRTNIEGYFKNDWVTLYDTKRTKAYKETKINKFLNGVCLID